jgi:hypothetical protein
MKVFLSERDRAAIFTRLQNGSDWGGSEAALAARLDAWEALQLDKLAALKPTAKLSVKAVPVEISTEAVEHLLATLPLAHNMHPELGRAIALVMRALRKACPPRPPLPAPSPTPPNGAP